MNPILMTKATMVIGLIPLVFAYGAGSVCGYAIRTVVVISMLVVTVFTLFMLPTSCVMLARGGATSSRKFKVRPSAHKPPFRRLVALASRCPESAPLLNLTFDS